MLAKLFNSGQRNAQRYIKQLSQSDADQRLALLAQMRHAQDSGALQPVPVPLQQFLNEQLATEDNIEVKLALVAWIDDLDALASLLSNDVTQQAAAKRVVELNPKNSDLINDPRVVNERITSASASEVNALVGSCEDRRTISYPGRARSRPRPTPCAESTNVALGKRVNRARKVFARSQ